MPYGLRAARSDHELTPELALVDPVLAERARLELADSDDTLARIEALIQASRMSSLVRQNMEISGRRGSEALATTRRAFRRGQPQFSVLVGCVAAGVLVVAFLLGIRVDLRGTPAGADTAAVEEVPWTSVPRTQGAGDETSSQPKVSPMPPANKSAPQRFVWAPAPGASAYHIELFRGSSKVFEADTKQPAITIPAHWTFGGRTRSLEPAEYRWNVWPMFSGRRAARAIVQAKLAIPSR